jgi:hypothetical protein
VSEACMNYCTEQCAFCTGNVSKKVGFSVRNVKDGS